MTAVAPPASKPIGQQVRLPLSKAAEIAYQNIRLRLGRSMLVMSAIVLALAFFVSIQVNLTVLDGMRAWIGGFAATAEGRGLTVDRERLTGERDAAAERLRERLSLVAADATGDVQAAFGGDFDALRDRAGRLPVGRAAVGRAASDAEATAALSDYVAAAADLRRVRDRQGEPEQLRLRLEEGGVATTADKVVADRTRTRWLMGLALLVAFVGILNAMLMSVTERFREIGTMKCLGALDGFIIKLFLLESLIQGLVGTVVGVLLGVGLSLLLAWAEHGGYAFVNLPWPQVWATAGVALLVGVGLTVGGALLPAWQAAKMQPIVAMRTDV